MNILHPAALALAVDGPQSRILLVDDDPDCLDEYAEVADSLGYQCVKAADAGEALRKIADDPRIGIVVTDVRMPAMDGITFLDELASRFAMVRPIVPIVVTGFGTLDCAVQAMRFNAVDFLSKPVSPEELAAALRRASARRTQLARQMLQAQQTQLDEAAQPAGESGPGRAEGAEDAGDAGAGLSDRGCEPPRKEDLIAQIRSIIRTRKRRGDFLDSELFADPSWDILLDLTLAKLEGAAVPVSSACAAAQVPFTTAFRYVKQLVDAGMVRRWKDPKDHRRVLLELEDRTLEAMTSYLVAVMKRGGA